MAVARSDEVGPNTGQIAQDLLSVCLQSFVVMLVLNDGHKLLMFLKKFMEKKVRFL